jgi:hypothetical protein
MRFRTLALIGALAVAGIPLAASASTTPADRAFAEDSQTSASCPPGSWWTPAGYAEHGKYRPAHCTPDRVDY